MGGCAEGKGLRLATPARLSYIIPIFRHAKQHPKAIVMKPNEIARVETYLKKTFKSPGIRVASPKKAGTPIEVYVGDEFIGVLHRDEEDGEVSYALHITILEEDLPPTTKA